MPCRIATLPALAQLAALTVCRRPIVMQDMGAAIFGVPGAVGFSISFDPVTGEREEKLLMRGDKPFSGGAF